MKTFDEFIAEETRIALNENMFGAIKRAVIKKASDKVDSMLAKAGDHKSVGRMETRNFAHTMMSQFQRYIGRQGIKTVLKDDLVIFLKDLGYNMDTSMSLKLIYQSNSGEDFSGSDDVAEALDQVHELAENGKPIPKKIIATLKRFAKNKTSAPAIRFGLFKILREFPSAQTILSPINNLIGWGPIQMDDAMNLFVKMARMKTLADEVNKDHRDKKVKSIAQPDRAPEPDALDISAWQIVKNGDIFTQLNDRHKISYNQMISLAGMSKADNADFIVKLPENEMVDLSITLLQFYCAKPESTNALLKMIDEFPKDVSTALIEISADMQQEKGFSRGKCRHLLNKSLTDSNPRKSLGNKASFLGFLLEKLSSKFCFFKWAKDRFINSRSIRNKIKVSA